MHDFIISKLFACWFPIMLFVLCGFEHSVANMYFIPVGMLLGAAFAHNFGLASSGEGPTSKGQVAVIVCLAALLVISFLAREANIKMKVKGDVSVE